MDLQSFIGMASTALDRDRDGQLEIHEIMSALGPLLASNASNGGQGGLDLSQLVASMNQGGLGQIVQSWLSDGANMAVSIEQLQAVLGQDKIDTFAQMLGIDSHRALQALQDILPNLVDQSSRGGELLQGTGGNAPAEALSNMVGGLIGGLFKR